MSIYPTMKNEEFLTATMRLGRARLGAAGRNLHPRCGLLAAPDVPELGLRGPS
jgi:hypothetical protein